MEINIRNNSNDKLLVRWAEMMRTAQKNIKNVSSIDVFQRLNLDFNVYFTKIVLRLALLNDIDNVNLTFFRNQYNQP